MSTRKGILLSLSIILSIFIIGCETADTASTPRSLATNNFIDIVVSSPEGSGALRTLTLHYLQDGEKKQDILDDITQIDNKDYDNEKKEQVFTESDYDGDGFFDIIVFQEFWFPDITLAHAEVPEWPTIYEYNQKVGFVLASSKHKDYFMLYTKSLKDRLSTEQATMSDNAILALQRLIYAAESVADGSFIPESTYNDLYYEDVYTLTNAVTKRTSQIVD